ncbi:V-type ATPase subunit [Ruminococcaceae bacterium OttesenSCG-928-A16]|nr:V-type ATPase subunit [Ruminococcaceae bacterium OttesenSCG-928-A16]
MAQANAILPKARGMYAKRLQPAQYEELMRRRTVPEVAAFLKKHPYYKDSFATLSPTDPHREQIEELLNSDIFYKYETLARYDYTPESFTDYFIIECEVHEILRVLRMLSAGVAGRYLKHLPPFLAGKIQFDLFALAEARSFNSVLEVLRRTPYYRVLYPRFLQDPFLKDYPATESAVIAYYYSAVFALAKKHLTGQEAKQVTNLFSQEAENYNINVILRAKTYFGKVYTAAQIRPMLLPYTYRISKQKLNELLEQTGTDGILALFREGMHNKNWAPGSMDEYDVISGRRLYHHAERLLHLTTSPSAAVAAFIFLVKMERDNVINVVEGVRYGLPPEKIRVLLRY